MNVKIIIIIVVVVVVVVVIIIITITTIINNLTVQLNKNAPQSVNYTTANTIIS
jgi:hypothetical protein